VRFAGGFLLVGRARAVGAVGLPFVVAALRAVGGAATSGTRSFGAVFAGALRAGVLARGAPCFPSFSARSAIAFERHRIGLVAIRASRSA
jgi:hypothetical protein